MALEHDARGEPIRGGRRINAPEATIVRRIFTEFASGKSPRRIAKDLNREGVRGPAGADWGPSTINGNAARGTGILNNEQRPRYLVSGLAKCGACGASYVKISKHLFGCAAARDRGTCDNRLNIRIEVLERTILDSLRERLMAPELFREFCTEFHRELNRLQSEGNAELDAQRAELAKIERRTRKLVELITEDDAPVKALKAELRTLEARQAELEKAVAITAAPAPLIHPDLAEVHRQKVAALHEALADSTSRDEAFDTIRSLIEEIRLVPESGELRIEIKGELGGILSLCEASERGKPGQGGRAVAEQIKMVAGMRNLLYRTRVAHFGSRA